jgi:acetyltransferase-like isoleucine patch superfamily enzyme
MTWPHKVSIGEGCVLESAILFKHDGPWSSGISIEIGHGVFIGRGCEFNIRKHIQIGHDSLIGSGCKFIDHDHGIIRGTIGMREQESEDVAITVERDVWLGVNVVVLKGVTIGEGAVVGAGAVVTKSIPPFEIWGGVPARKIGERPTQDHPANPAK